MGERVAIIGGGMAGLTAAYLLGRKYEITLYEKDGRLGGNAHTIETRDGHRIDVSIFFFNKNTYPNFFRLLDEIGLPVKTGPMTGASQSMIDMDTGETLCFHTDLGAGLPWRMLSPTVMAVGVRLLANLARGLRMFRAGRFQGLSMEESLKLLPGLKGRASHLFMFPLCVIASMHYGEILRAPASHFWGKVDAHFGSFGKLLGWRLIEHRTDDYIEALARGFCERVVLGSRIERVSREAGKVTLKMADGSEAVFDHVVFACHADRALGMLENPTEAEKRLLGAWTYHDGLVVVHRDAERFPKKELLGTYDYIYTDRDGEIETSVNASYAFQIGVDDDCPYLGTQYPNFPIREELVEFKRVFRTPIFTPESSRTIAELPRLNGIMNTYYCGSHFGHGIHEDAVTSAVEVARMLGVEW